MIICEYLYKVGGREMYLEKLAKLLKNNNISDGMCSVVDKDNNLLAGMRGGCYELFFKEKWLVRLIEFGRGYVYDEKFCNTEREACIEFLKMSDEDFHLASHIPEFEEKAAS